MRFRRLCAIALVSSVCGGARAGEDFGTDTEWAAHFPQSQAICRSVATRQIPEADVPDARTAAKLKGCDPEALYYGIGRPADPVKARQCAILQVKSGAPEELYDGRNILMMVYANGRGGRRDLDLAIRMACLADTAPAEHDNRVKALTYMKQHPAARDEIDVCTDMTSGIAFGACGYHELRVTAARRQTAEAGLSRSWSPAARAAFADLKRNATAFVEARSGDETYMGGTIRAARAAGVEEAEWKAFDVLLSRISRGALQTSERRSGADARLNATYTAVMRGPFGDDPDEIKANGVRKTQRAWIAYRDAWIRFAALAYPKVSQDQLATVLTQARERQLRRLHEDPEA